MFELPKTGMLLTKNGALTRKKLKTGKLKWERENEK